MSADIVNLRRVRKDRKRAEAAAQATANRAVFGRTREERDAEADRKHRLDRHLDAHRLPVDGEPA